MFYSGFLIYAAMVVYFFVVAVAVITGFFLGMLFFKKMALKEIIKENANKAMNGIMLRAKQEHMPSFSPFVQSISPKFIQIYDDCEVAENYDLSNITGISYGKALEFLIRDYAISQNPGDRDKIIHARLVDCIKLYIKDASIKNSTDIARWLRNDETHYEKKYGKADVNSLKALIKLTVLLIDNEHQKSLMDKAVEKIKADITT